LQNKEQQWKIPLYKIFTDDEDIKLITNIVKRGNNWALGPEIEELEKKLANYVGVDYCLTLNSGTSALHASLLSSGVGNSDEILVPSFSFISTANAALFVNSKPVFVDIEEETFGMNPELIEQNISNKTKAIIPMDYGGQSCKIFEIKEKSDKNNLILIEDAAESLGSKIKGSKVGSVSDIAIFSFCGNKVLTTGEGGAIVTNSKEKFEKIKLIRSHGRIDEGNYFSNPNIANYYDIGYNWRMSSITASLGISQLDKLEKIISMRQKNAEYISTRISKWDQIKTPKSTNENENIFQMYTIRLKNKNIRDELQKFLLEKRIFSKIYFTPIHLSKFYMNKIGTKKGDLPVTEKVSDQVLTLPLYPNMEKEEMDYIVESVNRFFENYNLSGL
jgi:perosamine synthetase